MTGLNELGARCFTIACDRGFHDHERRRGADGVYTKRGSSLVERMALVGTEVSEAIEELRKCDDPLVGYVEVDGKPQGFASELADIIIRVAEVAAQSGIDLDTIVAHKVAYNETRSDRHGGKLL